MNEAPKKAARAARSTPKVRTAPPARSAPSAAMPELNEFLCFAIYSAGHAFGRVYKPLLEALGLTYPQYLVMAALWQRDGQTVGEIGEALFLESSTLTPLLKRLESAGLLARRRDTRDERQVLVHLTKEGAALRGRAQNVPGCVLDASGLSLENLKRLQRDISALRDNLLASVDTRDA